MPVKTEEQTLKAYGNLAKRLGIYEDFKRIIDRYKSLLLRAKDKKEYQQIQIMGNVEVHKLFDFRDGLSVDGVVVLTPTASEKMLIDAGYKKEDVE